MHSCTHYTLLIVIYCQNKCWFLRFWETRIKFHLLFEGNKISVALRFYRVLCVARVDCSKWVRRFGFGVFLLVSPFVSFVNKIVLDCLVINDFRIRRLASRGKKNPKKSSLFFLTIIYAISPKKKLCKIYIFLLEKHLPFYYEYDPCPNARRAEENEKNSKQHESGCEWFGAMMPSIAPSLIIFFLRFGGHAP